jgi:Zn-finger nucleic acid-binding protein
MHICPKCPGTLKEIVIEQTTVDYCESCEGLWFDEGELKKVIENLDNLSDARFDGAEITGPIKELLLTRPSRCPKCKDHPELIRKTYSKKGITIFTDTCSNCNGVWLDGGELSVLKKTFYKDITNRNLFLSMVSRFILRK